MLVRNYCNSLVFDMDESVPGANDQPNEDQINAQKEMMLKQILSSEARLRLNNVKMVKPELANLVENYLIGLSAQGKAQGQITDEQLKQILLSAQQPKREFKINRV